MIKSPLKTTKGFITKKIKTMAKNNDVRRIRLTPTPYKWKLIVNKMNNLDMRFPSEVVLDILNLAVAGKLQFSDGSNYFKDELNNETLPKQ